MMKLSVSTFVIAGLSLTWSTSQAANLRGQSQQRSRALLYKTAPIDNKRGIFYPNRRFAPWEMLDDKTKIKMEMLEYSEKNWNVPGECNTCWHVI